MRYILLDEKPMTVDQWAELMAYKPTHHKDNMIVFRSEEQARSYSNKRFNKLLENNDK
jgi:hypothetical protein